MSAQNPEKDTVHALAKKLIRDEGVAPMEAYKRVRREHPQLFISMLLRAGATRLHHAVASLGK